MNLKHLIFGVSLLLFTACGDNSTEKQIDLLVGHWDLVEGKRNGKVTESLRGTFFEFNQAGKMSTNLPIKGGTDSPFTLEENVIIQTIVNDIKIRYTIEELTAKSLKMSTSLRGFDFSFALEKEMSEDYSSLKVEEGKVSFTEN